MKLVLTTNFYKENPKKKVEHKYSESEYTTMRENLSEQAKAILGFLTLNGFHDVGLRFIKISLQIIGNAIQYAFSTQATRSNNLHTKNLKDGYNQIHLEIERLDFDPLIKASLFEKLDTIIQAYDEQNKYLNELEDNAV